MANCQCCKRRPATAWTPDSLENVCFRCLQFWVLCEEASRLSVAWRNRHWADWWDALWATLRLCLWTA